ncbi:MAG: ADP-ribosylglycohydrolase family protein [Muribaculaceae bacterium]|nr:ADP-ribosylglycohydrolase family protein [Alistipes senegalensis]MCM1472883.1 ADP-ribosylglycohydrolase family protein [Muribaculaceae bacterium]
MNMLDKYKGCLIGGAVGDALGYIVEFFPEKKIFGHYGENGIIEYELRNNKAIISDDTQMTLFTANGLLLGAKDGSYIHSIYDCYKEWFVTQNCEYKIKLKYRSWLVDIPELWERRAPGFTCISAISSGKMGSVRNPINDSKGCGGVMRVAPIGLFFKDISKISQTDMIAAEASAITHGHELGYIPSACFVHIINLISHSDIPLKDAVSESISHTKKLFKNCKHIDYFCQLMNKALKLSRQNINDLDAIHELGEGWVAEETLSIAVYCALKYENNFEKAIITSVNHNGDSDSTGAVTGNILGSYLGMNAIPEKFLENLEIKDVISEIACDLYNYTPENINPKYLK